MTIGALYDRMTDQLKTGYDEREAASVSSLVLESRLGIRRIDRILRKSDVLDSVQITLVEADLKALLQDRPVQYVLGEAWFDGLLLKVNEQVLIPRPETEELIDWIAKDQAERRGFIGLDIGTGSGCISIALKTRLPSADMHALDISVDALRLAAENAVLHQMPIRFHQLNFLDEKNWSTLPVFDLLVSNPPYITQQERRGMHDRVLNHEPAVALFVGDDDPLLFYRTIARFARYHLRVGGTMYLEINEAMGSATQDLLETEGLTAVELRKDLQGKDRMIRATMKG